MRSAICRWRCRPRLLRVLQEKEVAPLGASRSVPVNFALICATHRNLTQRVSAGEFREDLLWRLREYALALPPLREWPALETFIATLWHDLGGASRRVTLFKRAAGSPQPAAVAGKRTPAAERPEGNAGSRR
ncbi:putative Fis-type transcriptional regulator [Klebsiella pneumoniae]|uniref:Putative Fis-type transcriptional regulator n=1 Tax=Klebsiella pneumoniae TaxID=573 RepID=A0A378FPJ5_KLEPN|nr:putative Fis-type transcriptional regulator [Klebsiella pneumoniae]